MTVKQVNQDLPWLLTQKHRLQQCEVNEFGNVEWLFCKMTKYAEHLRDKELKELIRLFVL